MNKRLEFEFKRIYIIFSSIFLLLVLGYVAGMLYMTGFGGAAGWLSFWFAAALLVTGGAWIWMLQSKVAAVIHTIHDIVDGAMSGRERMTGYAETSLSALEHKLIRYIDVSKAHEKANKKEKNNIKALISDISHQTKTPLSNIVLYSQLLEESRQTGEDAEDIRHLVAQIKGQSEKLNWLIQSLIKMSRLETGIIAIRASVHPVLQTITGAVSQIYAGAEQKHIEIAICCDTETAASHDRKWTGEALFNILENAVKYSEPGGRIHISAHSGEMFCRIDIADQGIGIEESELNLIFQRFYRCKKAAEYEGVGIGLYLAREIITSQGGYIRAASTPGEGTVFSVFLPAV
ncbi:HAMP domain-containing sensor histidine kinase [Paenibacillus thiaminolyticus]|uniref:sensor histidine kinase n=1 Tax=Paenibacillus thiaminolyticus TaxID=49283 RepID=UPI003D282557